MATYRLLYASIEGNTTSFIKKLTAVAEENGDTVDAQVVGEETDYAAETKPFVAVVPTYLTGGTGTGLQVVEIFTNALADYIDFADNDKLIKGVVGSGNRNFNDQYILTAKRYAQKYSVPVIGDYELRGSVYDAEKIYQRIKETLGE
ncbi:ribonucleotide reduction protein [Fructobacillus pseudoficulneus]|uniref:Ribonucleotide reduction protein n=1 Tax=Fructobacillus pseudoficulneus TaxID=220714 RepID=A0A3F3GU72_9LACO|nr:class Ib ribonucleoside-diphosphate reductase assembly flavoprotein NrdI [Fructobacillus pseudoficulneus]GAP02925.1 ribonucleotide reduction protein [Fructobacillus pseudoficulneus]SEH45065.1 protein involved in ribonucleotide reduction [Fructobacillus pseudoficulneus]